MAGLAQEASDDLPGKAKYGLQSLSDAFLASEMSGEKGAAALLSYNSTSS